jgi:hypothetical protein
MAIVAGFDVHRAQITFDALDRETGELRRGRIGATPEGVREWVGRFAGEQIRVAVEACTGWRFVCEALAETGAVAHLAEAGRDERAARQGAAREDRPRGRPLAARAARRRSAAGGLDPAGARARVAHPQPFTQEPGRRARRGGCSESKRRSFTTASPVCRTSCSAPRGAMHSGSIPRRTSQIARERCPALSRTRC